MLVQQLLDISKIENGNLQYNLRVVNLSEFLNSQISVMQHILHHHTLTSVFCDDVQVMIDELRMEQVLSNILSNAGKYSERNTHIVINTNLSQPGFITVSITDQGRGMTAETTRSVFDKFYRAKDVLKSHSGLGMGLYITSKIITDHGGEIWVKSLEGNGSTFYFTIPLAGI